MGVGEEEREKRKRRSASKERADGLDDVEEPSSQPVEREKEGERREEEGGRENLGVSALVEIEHLLAIQGGGERECAESQEDATSHPDREEEESQRVQCLMRSP